MVYDKARELARMLSESDEYKAYKDTRERAFANDTTKALLKEYNALRIRAQGAVVSGKKDEECLARLQKIGEVLQLNRDASDYLIAEYRLNTMLGDVYRILAEALDLSLDALEE